MLTFCYNRNHVDFSEVKSVKDFRAKLKAAMEGVDIYISGLFKLVNDANTPNTAEFTRLHTYIGLIPLLERPIMYLVGLKTNCITKEMREQNPTIEMWRDGQTIIEAVYYPKDGKTVLTGMCFPTTNFPFGENPEQFRRPLKDFIPEQHRQLIPVAELEKPVTIGEQLIHLPKTWAGVLDTTLTPDMSVEFNRKKLASICKELELDPSTTTWEAGNMALMAAMLGSNKGKQIKKYGRLAVCNPEFFKLANGKPMDGVTRETFPDLGSNAVRQAVVFMLRFMYDAEFRAFALASFKANIRVVEGACHPEIDTAFGTTVPPRMAPRCWEYTHLTFYGAMGNGWSIFQETFEKKMGAPSEEMPTDEFGENANLDFWEAQLAFYTPNLVRV